MLNKALEMIEEQMKEQDEESLEYAVGERLIYILKEHPSAAEIVAQDLEKPNMDIEACAEDLTEHARKNQKNGGMYMSDKTADKLICEFYGIAGVLNKQDKPVPSAPSGNVVSIFDLMD